MTHCKELNNFGDILQTFVKSSVDLRPSYSQNQCDTVDNPNEKQTTTEYRFEASRLRSYQNWPVSFIEPAELARAGFFYAGKDDYVQCFACGIEMGRWQENDDPMEDHQRWRASCKFVRKQACGNVPLDADPDMVAFADSGQDVCGHYGGDHQVGHSSQLNELPLPNTAKFGSFGFTAQKAPVCPEYASYDARLRTFEDWPKSIVQTKEQLADAGFYYTGAGDQTRCYHCGGGLKDWDPDDNPWIQHAKWYKKCCYVLMVKGQAFINKVIGQPEDLPSKSVAPSSSDSLEKVEPAEAKAVATTRQLSPNKGTDDARLCKICYIEELGIVFLPCGHMVTCTKCAPSMTTCAVCRETVSMTVRAIIS